MDAELDIETLKAEQAHREAGDWWCGFCGTWSEQCCTCPTCHSDTGHKLRSEYLPLLIAALERAEEVADQGCEFCDHMVTDQGPEGEAHGHWWQCGECSNKRAHETSTIIWHLSDLLRLALERAEKRIPELERQRDEWAEEASRNQRHAIDALERAERVEKALAEIKDYTEADRIKVYAQAQDGRMFQRNMVWIHMKAYAALEGREVDEG